MNTQAKRPDPKKVASGVPDKVTVPPAPPSLVRRALNAITSTYKTFAERGIGISYGAHPALIDDCLDRALVNMRVLSGTGNQVLPDVTGTDTILHPSIVGVDTTTAGPSYQLSVVHNVEGDTWSVSASPGISWSILVLYQKGKR